MPLPKPDCLKPPNGIALSTPGDSTARHVGNRAQVLAGYQLGRNLLIGGAIGSAIGRSSDWRKPAIRGMELFILLENGEEAPIETVDGTEYFEGDRVQLIRGLNGTRVRRVQR